MKNQGQDIREVVEALILAVGILNRVLVRTLCDCAQHDKSQPPEHEAHCRYRGLLEASKQDVNKAGK